MLCSQEDNSNNYILQQHFIVQHFLIISVQFMYFTSETQALKINFHRGKDALLEKVVKADDKLK